MLINLGTNAIKYATNRSVITIECRESETTSFLRFFVTNVGREIPEHLQHKLFLPYGRIESESEENPNGLGLGLYICKEICHSLGGTIKCKSANSQTTFVAKIAFEKVAIEESKDVVGEMALPDIELDYQGGDEY